MEENKLLEKYKTPFFVFNIDTLIKRIEFLKEALSNAHLCFAIKANTFIVKELNDYVDRFEVCSDGEYQICKILDVSRNKIVLSGVNKSPEDFENIFSHNEEVGIFTSESLKQYELLSGLAQKYNRKIKMLLRLTSNNQFGMTRDEIINIIKKNNYDLIDIVGIEYFSGTQHYHVKRLRKELDALKEFIDELKSEHNFIVKELEYGPGLPVYYFQCEEEDFNEVDYLNELNNIIYENFRDLTVTLEIGRSIAADCGTYFTSVVDIKTNKSGNFAIVDGGINHLVYYGQTMAMKIPEFKIISSSTKELLDTYNICGSLCTINDIIVKQLLVPSLGVGDVFVFYKTGAYSVTEGMNLFLSRDLPKVILIKDNTDYLVRNKICSYDINCPKYEKKGEI